MVSRRAFAALVASSLLLMSCALITSVGDLYVGEVDDAGEEAAAPPSNDMVDADPSSDDGGVVADSFIKDVVTEVVDGCGGDGCFDMPDGFTLVAFGGTAKNTACPAGFGVFSNTVETPSLQANACTCGCDISSQPTCPDGTLVGHFGGGGDLTCPSAGGDMLANDNCNTDGFLGPFGAGNEHRYTPPAAVGGNCQAPANKNTSKLVYAKEGRVCQATTLEKCDTKVCPSPAPEPFVTCIATAGDVACPQIFPTKHLLGTSANFTCSSNCTCSLTKSCSGKVSFYGPAANKTCSGASTFSTVVDNVCRSTNAGGATPAENTFGSHKYVPDPPTVSCNTGGSTTPSTPALSQPTTVCCN